MSIKTPMVIPKKDGRWSGLRLTFLLCRFLRTVESRLALLFTFICSCLRSNLMKLPRFYQELRLRQAFFKFFLRFFLGQKSGLIWGVGGTRSFASFLGCSRR